MHSCDVHVCAGNSVDARGATALARVLKTNTTLHVLNVSCTIIQFDAPIFSAACACTEYHVTLHLTCYKIKPPDNRIGDGGLAAFGDALLYNTGISKLLLGSYARSRMYTFF